MANFEVVVRPVVFPNIRPQAPRVLPPEDDPEKGICVIRGNPAKSFDLSYSYSFNASGGGNAEVARIIDEGRVYQEDDDGEINHENFVDIEVAKKIRKRGPKGDDWSAPNQQPSDPPPASRKRDLRWASRYKPMEEKDNIKIVNRDVVIDNPDETSEE